MNKCLGEFELVIIGGGVAGQLAKRYFGGKFKTAIVGFGSKSNTALFRSKSAEIPLMLGVKAGEVFVSKFIASNGVTRQSPTPKDMNRYSMKVCGKICKRSICDVDNNINKRYVFDVPNDVDFERCVTSIRKDVETLLVEFSDGDFIATKKIISTIPMPKIIDAVGLNCDKTFFNFSEITVARFILGCEVSGNWQQTVYFPDDDCHVYRATLNNNGIIAEFVDGTSEEIVKQEIMIIAATFGIKNSNIIGRAIHFMKHGKIIGGKESKQRLRIMTELTKNFNVYSFGRYATWNESVKTEDLVHDLKKIETMIGMSNEEKEYKLRMVAE